MNSEFQYKFELLKQEIDILQNGIRTYDNTLFMIKGWSITIFSAFITFAADKDKPVFLIYCGISIMLFWLLDSIYKSIQRIYISRYNEIESFLKSSDFDKAIKEESFDCFQVVNTGSGFKISGKEKYKAIFRAGIMLHNFLPYLVMLILTSIAYLISVLK